MGMIFRGVMILLAVLASFYANLETAIYILLLAILLEIPEETEK